MSMRDGIYNQLQASIEVAIQQPLPTLDKDLNPEERILVFCWNTEEVFQKFKSKETSELRIHYLEGYSMDSLIFTGSEFRHVILFVGRKIVPTSKQFLLVIYNIVSRATKRVKIFCQDSQLADSESLLNLTTIDVTFDKLRSGDNLGSKLFTDVLTEASQQVEALKRICVTQNKQQYDLVKGKCHPALKNNTILDSVITFFDDEYFDSKKIDTFRIFNFHQEQEWRSRNSLDLTEFPNTTPSSQSPKTQSEQAATLLPPNCTLEAFDIYCLHKTGELWDVCIEEGKKHGDSLSEESVRDHQRRKMAQQNIPFVQTMRRADPMFFRLFLAFQYFDDAEFLTFFQKNESKNCDILFNMADGEFTCISAAISELSAKGFDKLMELVSKHSIKFSDHLDEKQKNILMYCTVSFEHFKVLAERAQNDLENLLSQTDRSGKNCFFHACLDDNIKVVKLLLEMYHYDWSEDGFTILSNLIHYKMSQIFTYLFETLIKKEITLNSEILQNPGTGENILMLSSSDPKMMKIVLEFARKKNILEEILCQRDHSGRSCLMHAALLGNVNSVELFIDTYKFDWKNDINLIGKNIIQVIRQFETSDMLKFSYSRFGADFLEVAKLVDNEGYTCLHYACDHGRSVETVKLILQFWHEIFPLPRILSHLIHCLARSYLTEAPQRTELLNVLSLHLFNQLSSETDGNNFVECSLTYPQMSGSTSIKKVKLVLGPTESNYQPTDKLIFQAFTDCRRLRFITDIPIDQLPNKFEIIQGSDVTMLCFRAQFLFILSHISEYGVPQVQHILTYNSSTYWEHDDKESTIIFSNE